MDPDIDFGALFAQFDTLLMGRRTFEGMVKSHGGSSGGGLRHEDRRLFAHAAPGRLPRRRRSWPTTPPSAIARLKAKPGKDLWLFGGGDLFRSLAALGLVDRVEVALVPIMLGGGVPSSPPDPRVPLKLDKQRTYRRAGSCCSSTRISPGNWRTGELENWRTGEFKLRTPNRGLRTSNYLIIRSCTVLAPSRMVTRAAAPTSSARNAGLYHCPGSTSVSAAMK